ncbi:MAG: hypothetical protein J5608_02250 [Alphaproteobacteria bacterium]|nr:hypothetical protein [Alphaproteobacteria bacterium]
MTPRAVGTQTITVTATPDGNHTQSSATYTLTVNAGTITATANNKSLTYNGTNGANNGTAQSCANVTNISPSGTTLTYATQTNGSCGSYGSSAPTLTNAGTSVTVCYKITKTNYTTKTGTYTCTMGKASGGIVITDPENNNASVTSSTTLESAFPTNRTATATCYGAGTISSVTSSNNNIATVANSGSTVTMTPVASNANTTTITVNCPATTNYNSSSGTFKYKVNNGTITATANNKSLTYTGSAQSCGNVSNVNPSDATVQYAFQVNGSCDGVTYGSAPTMTNVSESPKTVCYKITKANYTDKTGTYTCTMGKADCTLGFNETSGSTPYGTNKTFTVTSNPSGGTLTVSPTATGTGINATASISGTTVTMTPRAVGSQTITVTSAATSNYNSCSKNYTLTVSKGNCTVNLSATSGTITYPTANTTFTASSTSGGTLTVSPTATGSGIHATAAISNGTVTVTPRSTGTQTITVTSAATTNYNACSATYTATVNAKTINIDNDGGTGTCEGGSITCSYEGDACTAPSWNSSTCAITKGTNNGSKVLIGWNTEANSSSTTVAFGGNIANITGDILYAVWGTPACTVTQGYGTIATTSANRPTCTVACRDGYHTSGTYYGEAGSLNVSYTCQANGYTITYKAGLGGTGNDVTQDVTYNATFTTKPSNTFSKANATFTGWSASAGSYPNANTQYTYTTVGDITMTATWTCNSGYYLDTNSQSANYNKCLAAPANWTCPGGNDGIAQCYRNVILNKNGMSSGASASMTLPSNSGCKSLGTGTGTSSQTLVVYYGVACALPTTALSGSATGTTYTGTGSWSTNANANLTDGFVTSITVTGTDATITYYAGKKYTCAAGYYLNASTNGACTQCSGFYYCKGITAVYYSTGIQGRWICPAANTHIRTTFPANYYESPQVTGTNAVSKTGMSAITQCEVQNNVEGTRGGLNEHATYNSTTEKYDVYQWHKWWSVNAGYYLTNKDTCGSWAYYGDALVCPAGSYCPGKEKTICNSGNQATVHTTNFGLESCPSGYPNSETGSSAITQCYSNTKSRAWTGSQTETIPTNCKTATFGTCSNPACDYVAYSNAAGTGDGTLKSGCATNNANCAKPVTAVTASENYYVSSTNTCSACSGFASGNYPNSDDGNTGGKTACYSNTRMRAWTGNQVNGATPTGCTVTAWNACSIDACPYVMYSNAEGTGDGELKSGCATNNENCTKTVQAVSANNGYYAAANATTCTACPTLTTGYSYVSGTGWTTYSQCKEEKGGANCSGGKLTKTATSASAWGNAVSTLTAPAGSYVNGESCDLCATGSYTASANSLTSCTMCTNGTTTNGTGQTSCNATCVNNNDYDYAWATPVWNNNNPTHVCEVASCAQGSHMSTEMDLPSGYTQLAYLESTGTQYIDTGVMLSSDDVVYEWAGIDNAKSNSSLFGAEAVPDTNTNWYSGILYSGSTSGSRSAYMGSTRGVSSGYNGADGVYHSWVFSLMANHTTSLVKDGVEVGHPTWSGTLTRTNTIGLYSNHYANGSFNEFAALALNYFRILDHGVLVFNGIPARRNSDGVFGMYDTVSGTFKTNAGSGTFVAGPVTSYANSCEECVGATYQATNGSTATSCTACPTGYDYNTDNGKTAASLCQTNCAGGSTVITANQACSGVGTGYWSAGGVVNYGSTGTRTACPTGLTTTGSGAGADEAGDCGRVLHVGSYSMRLRSNKKTSPSIMFDTDNNGEPDLYGNMTTTQKNMSSGSAKKLRVKRGNTTYYLYDDTAQ